MAVNFSQAIAAYAAAKSWAGGTGPTVDQAGTSFADLVAQAERGAVEVGHKGEQVSMQTVANQANLNEIVTAVTSAEVTLQTVVATRDRVIQAYQEIIRMPI